MWPLSRTGFSKQFLCLTGNESLFQQAAKRLACLGQDGIQVAAPFIVSGEDHRFLASEQLREVGIRKTVEWYLANPEWVSNVQSGAYKDWVNKQYAVA